MTLPDGRRTGRQDGVGVDGLTPERSETIGFVLAALFAGAIDVGELRARALVVGSRG
ncbi:hypothetical protein [Cellulomonas sp. P5_C5]